jgi:uncharacterized membrane protein
METWVALARGPFFWSALAFAILGLVRHVAVGLADVARVVRRAGDDHMPYRRIAKITFSWLFPVTRFGHHTVLGAVSFVFHVAIIVVPVFLAGHIVLWQRGLGLSWAAIPNSVADVLTIVAIASAAFLLVERAVGKTKRAMSRFQDYSLPIFVAIPFAAGLLVMHPAWNPLPYDVTLFIHVMSADVLLVLLPTTKLAHAVMIWDSHLMSEAAWHWPPHAGTKVGAALGKEGEPV